MRLEGRSALLGQTAARLILNPDISSTRAQHPLEEMINPYSSHALLPAGGSIEYGPLDNSMKHETSMYPSLRQSRILHGVSSDL